MTVTSCSDCHTPGSFLGHADQRRFLGGSEVGFATRGLGVFVGANLTPDKESGLGSWTRAQIMAAFTTGKRPDARQLASIMPWTVYARLSKADARAIAANLQSLPPVKNAVPGPADTVSVFVMDVLPAEAYNRLPPGAAPSGQIALRSARPATHVAQSTAFILALHDVCGWPGLGLGRPASAEAKPLRLRADRPEHDGSGPANG